MRLNKFIAASSGLSRRAADTAITAMRVQVNGRTATVGVTVSDGDHIELDGQHLELPSQHTTIMLNKPVGYVCSRNGQGSRTIYDLLPPDLHRLKPIGRLDKDSSGLLLLTDDGDFANTLTHPRFSKEKQYLITLRTPLRLAIADKIKHTGVVLEDGLSKFDVSSMSPDHLSWKVTLYEGRNRQIRRTFEAVGCQIVQLHRIQFGSYSLGQLKPGMTQQIKSYKE